MHCPLSGALFLFVLYNFCMIQFLVYGTVREITTKLGSNVPMVTMSTGHKLTLPNGCIKGDQVSWVANNEYQTMAVNKPYFVSCYQTHACLQYLKRFPLLVSEANFVYDTSEVKRIHHAMKDAAHAAVKCLKSLNARDRAIVLQCAGIGISGSVSLLSAVTATAEVLNLIGGATFEPTTFVTSLGLSGLTGVITAVQYDSLSQNLKDRVADLKRYETAMSIYQRTFKRYIPESGLGGVPLNPSLLTLIEDLRPMFEVSHLNMRRWWNARPQAANGVA